MRSGFGRSIVAGAVCGFVALTAGSRVARASGTGDGALTLPPVIVTAGPVRASKVDPHPEI